MSSHSCRPTAPATPAHRPGLAVVAQPGETGPPPARTTRPTPRPTPQDPHPPTQDQHASRPRSPSAAGVLVRLSGIFAVVAFQRRAQVRGLIVVACRHVPLRFRWLGGPGSTG